MKGLWVRTRIIPLGDYVVPVRMHAYACHMCRHDHLTVQSSWPILTSGPTTQRRQLNAYHEALCPRRRAAIGTSYECTTLAKARWVVRTIGILSPRHEAREG
jgi:hypothetical protein